MPTRPGGLSGVPPFERSTVALARMRQRLGPEHTLIGLGGVDSTALETVRAGADLVQFYTGFIYEGPGLIGRMLDELSGQTARENVGSIADMRDSTTDKWAAKTLP